VPFNGEGSLETFLAKFENMSRYLGWGESDRFYHLCASLEGTAGQVLWDAGSQADKKSVVDLLRTRFGTELQAERFKAELRARRRKPGESLQRVYQDVCRLVALAYPSDGPALTTHVAREAFVAALGDPALQLKVMEKEPKSIEDALNYATKQEAFETSLVAYGHTACGHAAGSQDKVFPGKQVKVRALGEAGSDTDMSSLCQQVNQLQAELSKTTRSLEGLVADAGRVQQVPPGSSYAGCVQQVQLCWMCAASAPR